MTHSKKPTSSAVLHAVETRRSYSKVTDKAPDDTELSRLVAAATRVADHSALHPWRLIALRGDARQRFGDALAEASPLTGKHAESLAAKPLRAPLLIAIVFTPQRSHKVHPWEQEAVASGVAHVLSLLLHEAGWGVIWRSGPFTRSEPVAAMHGLAEGELLLGWLYVGGIPDRAGSSNAKKLSADKFLTTLE